MLDDDFRYERYIPAHLDEPFIRSSSSWTWRDSQVHISRVGNPNSPVRMILIHGAGGNSAAMWPYAATFSSLGAYVTVPDLPGYGKTTTSRPGQLRYSDWKQMLVDFVEEEDDERPLIIMGASMGGMLAYDTAAITGLASQLVVTCLLDPRDDSVRERLTWHPYLAKIAGPALSLFAGPFANLRIPIRWIADMRHIANSPGLVKEVLSDKTGGGGRIPLGWMRSFLESKPSIEPEDFKDTPVTMLHPDDDKWTPLSISLPFFNRIAAEKLLVTLTNCGHFPMEEPGFSTMAQEVKDLIDNVLKSGKA